MEFQDTWNILTTKISTSFDSMVAHLPNLVVAIVSVLFFVALAKGARNVLARILQKASDNKAVNSLLQTLLYVGVVFSGVFVALGVLNLDKTLTSLLAGAGVIGLALGFAFQEIAANFISGVFIAFKKPYKIGDIVKVEGFQGTVKDIGLRTTSIHTFQGLEVIVPNKAMFTQPVINYTSTPVRRVDLEVGVSYGDDLREVETIVKNAIGKSNLVLNDKPVELFYKEFGGSSINFQLRFWVDYPGEKDFLKARHESIILIKEAFDENNISIPFPIRTLDFGVKGGVNLEVPLKESYPRAVQ